MHNPYGEVIQSEYGWLPSKQSAIIGLSEASGIQFKTKNSNILVANTFGTGEQIKDAIDRGAKTIVIGMGGSATTDGGAGLLQALGLEFFDKENREVKDIPKRLDEIVRVDDGSFKQNISNCKFEVLCDVENPLLGEEGTSNIFAPQKGASPEAVLALEKCLKAWNNLILEYTFVDMAQMKFGGAAGGAAAGLYPWANAQLISGIDYFMDKFRLNDFLEHADFLITGEGKLDAQTLKGKGPYGLAIRSKRFGIPVIVFAGQTEIEEDENFPQIITINKSPNLQKEIENTSANLEEAACKWAQRLRVQ